MMKNEIDALEKKAYYASLLLIYGSLLTEKQRRCLEMHLLEDFSMSEIGESLQVSRQAVYDILHRSEQTMTEYEDKLGLAQRLTKQRQELTEIYDELQVLADKQQLTAVQDLLTKLAPYTTRAQEE